MMHAQVVAQASCKRLSSLARRAEGLAAGARAAGPRRAEPYRACVCVLEYKKTGSGFVKAIVPQLLL